jgi:hypothetical protein
MAKRVLVGGYMYNGERYGPGEADLPEGDAHKKFLARVDATEETRKRELDARVQSAVGGALPPGYDYRSVATAPTPFIAPESASSSAGGESKDASDPANNPAPRLQGSTSADTTKSSGSGSSPASSK